jgi:toxin ParE1/3/4
LSRELCFTPEALADLEGIFLFVAADSPIRARSYIEDIRSSCRKLTTSPLIGVDRSGLRTGLRILPLWRRIVVAYELPPDRVDILRIFSARQDYEALMGPD